MAMFLCYTPDAQFLEYSEADMQQAIQSGYAEGYASGEESGEEEGLIGETWTWGEANDLQIAMMVAAADQGLLDLTEFWAIGNERAVHLNAMEAMSPLTDTHIAQDVTYVLVAVDTKTEDSTNPCYNYPFVTATTARSHPSFIIQQKDCLYNYANMNSTNTNSGSWNSCARRTWCNSTYKNSIQGQQDYDAPSLVACFKQVSVKTASEYNASTLTTSQDCFFLPTEKEVFGVRTYSVTYEADALAQWDYYKTTANRAKKTGVYSTTDPYMWKLRSPYASGSTAFCNVSTANTASYSLAYANGGVAPCCCI